MILQVAKIHLLFQIKILVQKKLADGSIFQKKLAHNMIICVICVLIRHSPNVKTNFLVA